MTIIIIIIVYFMLQLIRCIAIPLMIQQPGFMSWFNSNARLEKVFEIDGVDKPNPYYGECSFVSRYSDKDSVDNIMCDICKTDLVLDYNGDTFIEHSEQRMSYSQITSGTSPSPFPFFFRSNVSIPNGYYTKYILTKNGKAIDTSELNIGFNDIVFPRLVR